MSLRVMAPSHPAKNAPSTTQCPPADGGGLYALEIRLQSGLHDNNPEVGYGKVLRGWRLTRVEQPLAYAGFEGAATEQARKVSDSLGLALEDVELGPKLGMCAGGMLCPGLPF